MHKEVTVTSSSEKIVSDKHTHPLQKELTATSSSLNRVTDLAVHNDLTAEVGPPPIVQQQQDENDAPYTEVSCRKNAKRTELRVTATETVTALGLPAESAKKQQVNAATEDSFLERSMNTKTQHQTTNKKDKGKTKTR